MLRDYTIVYRVPQFDNGKWTHNATRSVKILADSEIHAIRSFWEKVKSKCPLANNPGYGGRYHIDSVK